MNHLSDKEAFLRQFVPPTGNFWGWRFSFFGLVLILLLSAWIAWRHYRLGVPFGFDEPETAVNPMVKPAPALKNE